MIYPPIFPPVPTIVKVTRYLSLICAAVTAYTAIKDARDKAKEGGEKKEEEN